MKFIKNIFEVIGGIFFLIFLVGLYLNALRIMANWLDEQAKIRYNESR